MWPLQGLLYWNIRMQLEYRPVKEHKQKNADLHACRALGATCHEVWNSRKSVSRFSCLSKVWQNKRQSIKFNQRFKYWKFGYLVRLFNRARHGTVAMVTDPSTRVQLNPFTALHTFHTLHKLSRSCESQVASKAGSAQDTLAMAECRPMSTNSVNPWLQYLQYLQLRMQCQPTNHCEKTQRTFWMYCFRFYVYIYIYMFLFIYLFIYIDLRVHCLGCFRYLFRFLLVCLCRSSDFLFFVRPSVPGLRSRHCAVAQSRSHHSHGTHDWLNCHECKHNLSGVHGESKRLLGCCHLFSLFGNVRWMRLMQHPKSDNLASLSQTIDGLIRLWEVWAWLQNM